MVCTLKATTFEGLALDSRDQLRPKTLVFRLAALVTHCKYIHPPYISATTEKLFSDYHFRGP